MMENEQRSAGDDSWLDLESVDHVLSTARSVRRKLDFSRPIVAQDLYDCINIATQAPTGPGGENWRFIVVTDAAAKQQLATLYCDVIRLFQTERGLQIKSTQQALMSRLHEIPAMIFVCTIGAAPGGEIPEQVGYYGSVLPAAWSLMLALRSRQIGCTWTSLLASRQAEVAAVLRLPADVVQTVMLPVAYMKGAALRRATRMDARQVTFWDAWDQGE